MSFICKSNREFVNAPGNCTSSFTLDRQSGCAFIGVAFAYAMSDVLNFKISVATGVAGFASIIAYGILPDFDCEFDIHLPFDIDFSGNGSDLKEVSGDNSTDQLNQLDYIH